MLPLDAIKYNEPRLIPMQQQQQPPPTSSLGRATIASAPREKKALTITDKHGNVIDLTTGTGKPVSKAESTTTTASDDSKKDSTTTTDNAVDEATSKLSSLQLAASTKSKQATGDALTKAAEEAIAAGSAKE
jgi:hypothetical protein